MNEKNFFISNGPETDEKLMKLHSMETLEKKLNDIAFMAQCGNKKQRIEVESPCVWGQGTHYATVEFKVVGNNEQTSIPLVVKADEAGKVRSKIESLHLDKWIDFNWK